MDIYKETMPSDAPSVRASSFDFADSAAKRPRRPGASMRRSVLRTALSWICTIKTTSLAGGLSTAYKAAVTSLALKGPLIKI